MNLLSAILVLVAVVSVAASVWSLRYLYLAAYYAWRLSRQEEATDGNQEADQ